MIFLSVFVRFRRWIEELCIRLKYWRNTTFRQSDRALRGRCPYRISREFLQQQGADDVYTYGETPLTTLDKIMRGAHILPSDHLYDLGCGPGRTSLWIRIFIGCEVTGVEQIPEFVEGAVSLPGLRFIQDDILSLDYRHASAIYLYGTGWPEPQLISLAQKLKVLDAGSCIITVSYPWSDYSDDPRLVMQKVVKGRFPWGKADVYIQRINNSPLEDLPC